MNLNATIFGQIISFIIFVWFCMKYVWYPLMSIIEKRQREISDNLASARYAKIESDRINSEALICLKAAKIKAQEIINNANLCKVQILDAVKYEAEQERSRILSQTRQQIIHEKNYAIEELKQGIGTLVINATEKVIKYSMNEKMNHNLVNTIIAELLHDED